MLKELTGYFNSIKKDLGKNEVYTKWNKKNLQGINSGMDESWNQFNDLEHKKEKHFNKNSKKKKEF